MRVEFLTQDDPLYILPFFDEFVRHYVSEFRILQIASSPVMGKRSRSQMIKELTKLYGPAGMARLTARLAGARILGKLPKRAGASLEVTFAQIPCDIRNSLSERLSERDVIS